MVRELYLDGTFPSTNAVLDVFAASAFKSRLVHSERAVLLTFVAYSGSNHKQSNRTKLRVQPAFDKFPILRIQEI